MKTELVVDALQMAVWRRWSSAGLVYHSDLGTQWKAISFDKRLEDVSIVPTWAGPGPPWTERDGGELLRHLEDRTPLCALGGV